jgi:hypothetical protein
MVFAIIAKEILAPPNRTSYEYVPEQQICSRIILYACTLLEEEAICAVLIGMELFLADRPIGKPSDGAVLQQ